MSIFVDEAYDELVTLSLLVLCALGARKGESITYLILIIACTLCQTNKTPALTIRLLERFVRVLLVAPLRFSRKVN